ncbi:sugar phosphate isomerase/epimerase [Paenibacillus alba]|uniref:sugar phosphate isomerase/epimerase family protein n=1 Tax=Paenibacillus alba TaxID=1197127 RepID=UPI0015661454|nr:sugar phosphate isomerase/epimerase [Paenibacillus alba]NQX66702.1 sugar phosphate isomerase/epimerase [Paenibacillus alba]
MKLAISNIAWDVSKNVEIVTLVKNYGVKGIEIAPTKVCSQPENSNSAIIKDYKEYWQSKDLELIAMQSLLFGKPDLSIFGPKQSDTLEYLYSIVEMASSLSTKALVFGSPKNRIIGKMDPRKAREQAIIFFSSLGEYALQSNVFFCIEANPQAYGCDFLTGTLDALDFVKEVNHPGVKLQIDTGTLFINRENSIEVIKRCLPYIGHFHISEPYLNLIGNEDHSDIADCLKDLDYKGWISIEMKSNLLENDVISVKTALDYVTKTYLK